ncbi:MAG: DUF4922 domain-containing protein [Acidimicrobiia bacterium]|nr:DUF4922 domain-containing protein [Acidimicrobiia bacterium]
MTSIGPATSEPLTRRLVDTWAEQIESGFVLGDPSGPIETKLVADPVSEVTFRLRWLPHRALRTDTAALEREGLLNPHRDETVLYRDSRDPSGHHCFLCPANIRVCHPVEELVPVRAGGRNWLAGTNFAWLARNHFTVIAEEHVDQVFDRTVIEAMLDLHAQTDGSFRVVYNGAHAGATIPWHLHLHITTDAFPVEQLRPDRELDYPTPVRVFTGPESLGTKVADYVTDWEGRDPEHHRVNMLVASRNDRPLVFVFLRDTRFTRASKKGPMAGWEVAGDLVYSHRPDHFAAADLDAVRTAFAEIRPPAVDPKPPR